MSPDEEKFFVLTCISEHFFEIFGMETNTRAENEAAKTAAYKHIFQKCKNTGISWAVTPGATYRYIGQTLIPSMKRRVRDKLKKAGDHAGCDPNNTKADLDNLDREILDLFGVDSLRLLPPPPAAQNTETGEIKDLVKSINGLVEAMKETNEGIKENSNQLKYLITLPQPTGNT